MTTNTTKLSAEALREIRERVEKASTPSWQASGNGVHRGIHCVATTHDVGQHQRVDDAEFIAHARQDVPRLLLEIERLKALLQSVVDGNVSLTEARHALQESGGSEGTMETLARGK